MRTSDKSSLVARYFISLQAMNMNHRHLREIDCSLAVVGGLSAGAESRGKSIHWTRMWRQKVLHSGCCGWQHNYYHQQRQAGWANEQSTSLRCLWHELTDFDATDLLDLQTGFHSIDFSADWILVWNTNYLQRIPFLWTKIRYRNALPTHTHFLAFIRSKSGSRVSPSNFLIAKWLNV